MAKFLYKKSFLFSKLCLAWSLFIFVSCSEKQKETSNFDSEAYKKKRALLKKKSKKNNQEKKQFYRKDDSFDYSLLKPPVGKYKNKSISNQVTATFYTNYGDMVFELYPNRMPIAVENFINLVNVKFYNGCEFFRIEEGFVIQAGDRTNTGYADAGYYFETEFHEELSHDRFGILSFANNNTKTNSSQFFITLSGNRQLDKQHPPFGYIFKGHDVLREIGELPVNDDNRPEVKVVIRKIEINGL